MTRSLSRLFALPIAAVALTACPPVEPPMGPMPGGELRQGTWLMDIEDVFVEGRCDGISPRDIVESGPYELGLRTSGRQVSAHLDGMDMRGGVDGRWLELHGFLSLEDEPGVPEEPRPGEEVVVESGGGADDEAPPAPCEVEPEPPGGGGPGGEPGATGPGISAAVYAEVIGPERFVGTMSIAYEFPGEACFVEVEMVAHFVGEGRPEEEPRPMEDEEWDDDDSWGDEDHGDEDHGDDDEDHGDEDEGESDERDSDEGESDEGEGDEDCDWEVEDC